MSKKNITFSLITALLLTTTVTTHATNMMEIEDKTTLKRTTDQDPAQPPIKKRRKAKDHANDLMDLERPTRPHNLTFSDLPGDLFDGILSHALKVSSLPYSHLISAPTKASFSYVQALMRLLTVSKNFYQNITGFSFTDRDDLWGATRSRSNTLLKQEGAELGLSNDFFTMIQPKLILAQELEEQYKRENKAIPYVDAQTKKVRMIYAPNTEPFGVFLERKFHEHQTKVTAKRKIAHEYLDYFLFGKQTTIIPRYIIEASRDLLIPFSKLCRQDGTTTDENTPNSLSTRLMASRIQKVGFRFDKGLYEATQLDKGAFETAHIINTLPPCVTEIDLTDFLLTPQIVTYLSKDFSQKALNTITLSPNFEQNWPQETWDHFGDVLRAPSVRDIHIMQHPERINPSSESKSWMKNFFLQFHNDFFLTNEQNTMNADKKNIMLHNMLSAMPDEKMYKLFHNLHVNRLFFEECSFGFSDDYVSKLKNLFLGIISAPHITEAFFSQNILAVTHSLSPLIKHLKTNKHLIDQEKNTPSTFTQCSGGKRIRGISSSLSYINFCQATSPL